MRPLGMRKRTGCSSGSTEKASRGRERQAVGADVTAQVEQMDRLPRAGVPWFFECECCGQHARFDGPYVDDDECAAWDECSARAPSPPLTAPLGRSVNSLREAA